MAFNPNEHMMQLKGRDYLQVMWRLVWFRDEKPGWSIDTALIEADADHAVFRATISDESGSVKSTGHGSESKRDFDDYLEKAETKAVGRALAMLGYGTQFAADELDEGDRIVDSPVQRGSKEAAQAAGQRKLEEINAQLEGASNAPRPMATEEQKSELRGLVNIEQLQSCNKIYGQSWEKMTRAAAEQLINKCKRGASA